MSNYVVHFTQGSKGTDSDHDNMMSICSSQRLKPRRSFGIGKDLCPNPKSQRAVCFTEVPPGEWERFVARRETRYGIGFKRDLIVSKGAGPIWYAYKDTPQWDALQQLMAKARNHPNAEIWKLAPLIDAPGVYGKGHYFFEWERELRHVGEFAFGLNEVAFLLIPEELHAQAQVFFDEVEHENRGPAYHCPFIDPTWDRKKILEVLKRPP